MYLLKNSQTLPVKLVIMYHWIIAEGFSQLHKDVIGIVSHFRSVVSQCL